MKPMKCDCEQWKTWVLAELNLIGDLTYYHAKGCPWCLKPFEAETSKPATFDPSKPVRFYDANCAVEIVTINKATFISKDEFGVFRAHNLRTGMYLSWPDEDANPAFNLVNVPDEPKWFYAYEAMGKILVSDEEPHCPIFSKFKRGDGL